MEAHNLIFKKVEYNLYVIMDDDRFKRFNEEYDDLNIIAIT